MSPQGEIYIMKRNKIYISAAVITALCAALTVSVFTAGNSSHRLLANTEDKQDIVLFEDIPSDAWYAADVSKAYSYGLISGVSETSFAPDDTLSVASCIVMASRLNSIYTTGEELNLAVDGDPWYKEYVQYALDNGIIEKALPDYNNAITRAQFAGILANALPKEELKAINSVEDNSIPDVSKDNKYYDEIYTLYRAGVMVGADYVARAFPDKTIPRKEAAVILLRMADEAKRQKVTLSSKLTVYNDDNEKTEINALDFPHYEENGYDTVTIDVYTPDGRHRVVPQNRKKAWTEVGWYTYPVTTVYATDGRSENIPESDKDAWLAVDWYDHPVAEVYAIDGRSEVIPLEEKDAWLAVGWYDSPIITVYALDGRSENIPENEKDAWLAVGWYDHKIIPMPQSLLSKKITTTDIPVISIGTGGRSITSATEYTPCEVNLFNVSEDNALFGAKGGIRLRGNASRPARPYRIKFDEKQNLCGLNDGAKAKSWVLLNYPDGAAESMKNDIAFRIGRMLLEPDGAYSSDGQFVHLYINEGFAGVYLLCEQTQVNKHRVDVNEPEDGYTGTDVGYLVEIDNYSEKPYFWMGYDGAYVSDIYGKSRRLRHATYSIKSDTFSKEQEDFIAKYMWGAFHIVYEACEKGNYLMFDENYDVVQSPYTDAYETVGEAVDLPSIVDMYILYELMHDNDVGEGSFFMCVDFSPESKHKKLTFTAPWDFNWTCGGNATGSLYASTYCTDSFMSTFGDRSNPWFIVLYKQWWFRELVSKRWTAIGGSEGIAKCIAEEDAVISRYNGDFNRRNSGASSSGRYYLNWIQRRAEWLDTLWMK